MRLIPDASFALLTIYMEAEGESMDGKTAVAEVIFRRTLRKYSSDGTIAGTCLRAHQFSCWNTDSPSRSRAAKLDLDSEIGQECLKAWDVAVGGSNLSHGAVLYLNPVDVMKATGKLPVWAVEANKVARIGKHHFYVDAPVLA